MEPERKSRYELFLEEEAREAQPPKRCSRCKELKAASEFSKDKGTKTGLRSRCKRCLSSGKKRSKEDWFWKYFHAHTRVVDGCLEWTGYCSGEERATPYYTWGGRPIPARRVVYQLSIGILLNEEIVSTSCRNHKCVKQSHLKKMTQEEFDSFLRNNAPAGVDHGTYTKPETRNYGSRNGNAKLTEADVQAIRSLTLKGATYSDLACQYSVTVSLVGQIARREIWKHVE